MNTNDGESLGELFRAAQDALFGAFRWGADGSGAGQADGTAERILKSQEHAIRLMTAMTGVWAEMAKQGVAGPEGVRAFMEKLQKNMPTMGGALPNAEALDQMAEMWKAGGQRFFEAMMPAAPFTNGGGAGAGDNPWSTLMSTPGFGLSRQYQAKLGKTFAAWLDYQRRDLDYRMLLSRTWMKAFSLVMEKMAAKASEGESPKTARAALELWIDVADATFTDVFKTEAFSRAQSALVNASMALKKHRRALIEDMLIANDMPTRREVDEAHRMVYALRKELKAIKRQLKASSTDVPKES